ncbi:hypothetical protein SAMN05444320_10520 [Streptoalloteichus hindustanus]|uniref:Uncharacterized protein n=1 Tax=Streptoalloteichus hindustanus TaxID=2017 RepID=A0A1M5EJV9_STRHI|nr:hypothetical protein SAMN05444320_10520 [Streptoalloteichus hindustanus]
MLTSVGWWGLSLVLLTLISGAVVSDGEIRTSFLLSANHLDDQVLVPLAETAAYTGFMLSALTRWGYFRFWWVTWKFVLTVASIVLGVSALGSWLDASLAAARHGGEAPTGNLIIGTVFVLTALVVSTWLSVAKPGGRIRQGGRVGREAEPQPDPRLLAVVLVLPFVDHGLGLPGPMTQLLMVIGYAIYRARRQRSTPAPPRPSVVTVP